MDESLKHCVEQKKPARQKCLYEVQESSQPSVWRQDSAERWSSGWWPGRAQESSLGGEGDACVWKRSESYSGHLHTRTRGHQAPHWKASASYCLWIKPHWKRQTAPSRGRILGENETVVRVHLKLYLFISWCGPFFKSLLNLWQYFVCFVFRFFWPWSIWDLSSPSRDPHTACNGRQSLSYWTAREAHELKLLNQLHRTSSGTHQFYNSLIPNIQSLGEKLHFHPNQRKTTVAQNVFSHGTSQNKLAQDKWGNFLISHCVPMPYFLWERCS